MGPWAHATALGYVQASVTHRVGIVAASSPDTYTTSDAGGRSVGSVRVPAPHPGTRDTGGRPSNLCLDRLTGNDAAFTLMTGPLTVNVSHRQPLPKALAVLKYVCAFSPPGAVWGGGGNGEGVGGAVEVPHSVIPCATARTPSGPLCADPPPPPSASKPPKPTAPFVDRSTPQVYTMALPRRVGVHLACLRNWGSSASFQACCHIAVPHLRL